MGLGFSCLLWGSSSRVFLLNPAVVFSWPGYVEASPSGDSLLQLDFQQSIGHSKPCQFSAGKTGASIFQMAAEDQGETGASELCLKPNQFVGVGVSGSIPTITAATTTTTNSQTATCKLLVCTNSCLFSPTLEIWGRGKLASYWAIILSMTSLWMEVTWKSL